MKLFLIMMNGVLLKHFKKYFEIFRHNYLKNRVLLYGDKSCQKE